MFGVNCLRVPMEARCGGCNKTPAEITDPKITKLLACSQCKLEKYCGRACQKKDWPSHHYVCNQSKIKKLEPDVLESEKFDLETFEHQNSEMKKLAAIDKKFRRDSINFAIDLDVNSSSNLPLDLRMAAMGLFDMVGYSLLFDYTIENELETKKNSRIGTIPLRQNECIEKNSVSCYDHPFFTLGTYASIDLYC